MASSFRYGNLLRQHDLSGRCSGRPSQHTFAQVVQVQLAEKTALSERLAKKLTAAAAEREGGSYHGHEPGLSLASTQAKIEAKQAMFDELRNSLNSHRPT